MRQIRRFVLAAMVTVLSAVAVACNGGVIGSQVTSQPPPRPAAVASVTLAPAEVMGGQNSTGMVTLSSAAPTGGAVVTLSSDNTAASIPNPTVMIPAGAISATFTANTIPVNLQTVANITATFNGTSSKPLTVDPPTTAQVQSVTFPAPGTVQGGQDIVGTVTLSQAPLSPTVVLIESSNPAAAIVLSSSLSFPAGQTTANFTVMTTSVATQTVVLISATLNNTPVSARLTITPPPAPVVAITPPDGLTFGFVNRGTMSGALTVRLTNTGNATLTFSATPSVSGQDSADFAITGNTCSPGAPLAANGSCVVTLTFMPSRNAVENALLSFADNITPSPQSVMLTGTGLGPTVGLPNSLPFGPVMKGTTSGAQNVKLTNSGNAALNFTVAPGISGLNAGDFAITGSTCLPGTPVAANASCVVTLTFKPSTATGESASLNFSDNGTPGAQSVSLTGTGTTPVVVVPNSLAFGTFNVGQTSGALSLNLTNTGTAALNFSVAPGITGPNSTDFAITGNTCVPATPVAAGGGTCTVTMTFKPSLMMAENALLNFSDNATPTTQSVVLTGTGAGALTPVVVLPNSLPFGNVSMSTTSGAMSVTLKNTGTIALNFTVLPGVSGGNAADFAITANTCMPATPVAAGGGTCVVTLTFTPSTSTAENGSLDFTDNATPSGQSVSLTGTGTSPVVMLPVSVPFGAVDVNTTSVPLNVTLTNTGNGVLNFTALPGVAGANATDFVIKANTCLPSTGVAAGGGNCTVMLTFAPSATGGAIASLNFSNNAAPSAQSVALTGSGNHWIGLTWTEIDPTVTGYNVFRATVPGGPYTRITASPVATTSFMDSDPLLVSGTTYYYVVTAVSSGGETIFSLESNPVVFP